MTAYVLSETDRRVLQYVARQTEGSRRGRNQWVPEAIPHDLKTGAQWTFDDYRRLIDAGLLDVYEEWKYDWVRLTDAGWAALGSVPEGDTK